MRARRSLGLPWWSRFWTYSYRDYTPRWWHYLVPTWGKSDEYGRLVLVWPIHPFGWLCVAYRTCRCKECDEIREQTRQWELEERWPKRT